MPDIFTPAKRSAVMALIRLRGNRATELRLIALMREHGITGWRRSAKVLRQTRFRLLPRVGRRVCGRLFLTRVPAPLVEAGKQPRLLTQGLSRKPPRDVRHLLGAGQAGGGFAQNPSSRLRRMRELWRRQFRVVPEQSPATRRCASQFPIKIKTTIRIEICDPPETNFMNRTRRLPLLAALLLATQVCAEDFQGSTHPLEYDAAPVRYSSTAPDDPVSRLAKRIQAGEVKLPWDDKFGYLPGLLDVLQVPRSSQTVVFSKSSLQRTYITPKNPRSVYFNDDIYIGYVPGAPVVEISAVDPKLGAIFYALDQEKLRKPKFARSADCLQCHGGQRSLGVPGHVLRSVPTDAEGELETREEVGDMDHCTPLADRWAGWFVTGKHGAQKHRGNLIGNEDFARHAREPGFRGNLTDLREFFDQAKTLGPGSDIGALMVLQHQAHMHNYITRLNFDARQMLATYGHIRYLKPQTDAFLRCLLFTEETPLTAPIEGSPDFVRDFSAGGPRDRHGRSLRDLDLRTRLFKYPCSFLILNPAFDAMPAPIRDSILSRLHAILTGADKDPQFAKIAETDRRAILEILRETKPSLPDVWRAEK
jgi:hypothetical protein